MGTIMNRTIILVGIGGMLGSVFRFLVSAALTSRFPSAFPYGTFVVNVAGCFLVGVVYGFAQRCEWLTPEWRVFLAVGICGGFTTFSSFAFESVQLLQDKDYLSFAAYAALSFVLCLTAAFAGLVLTRG